jgi:hypothetical protein
MSEHERALHEQLRALRNAYEKDAAPYIKRLVALRAVEPAAQWSADPAPADERTAFDVWASSMAGQSLEFDVWRQLAFAAGAQWAAGWQKQSSAVAATVCTCPSGDGSLGWPCPARPPVSKGEDAETQKFNATRLRNVVALVGLDSAVPQGDTELLGCMGSVLGMVASALRKQQGEASDAREPAANVGVRIDMEAVAEVRRKLDGMTVYGKDVANVAGLSCHHIGEPKPMPMYAALSIMKQGLEGARQSAADAGNQDEKPFGCPPNPAASKPNVPEHKDGYGFISPGTMAADIVFRPQADGTDVLRLTSSGFIYKGVAIADAGEAYAALMKVLGGYFPTSKPGAHA